MCDQNIKQRLKIKLHEILLVAAQLDQSMEMQKFVFEC